MARNMYSVHEHQEKVTDSTSTKMLFREQHNSSLHVVKKGTQRQLYDWLTFHEGTSNHCLCGCCCYKMDCKFGKGMSMDSIICITSHR